MIRVIVMVADGIGVAPLAECFAIADIDTLGPDEAQRITIFFEIRDTLGGADIAEL